VKVFETFSFDIIIFLVLVISVLSGVYYGLYRQGGKTLRLLIPFIALYFLFNPIMKIYDSTLGKTFFRNSIYYRFSNALLVYVLFFALFCLFSKAIYYLFRPSVQKRVLNQESKLSRTFSGFLGLMNGYLLTIIILFILNPFLDINYQTPLTKFLNLTANEVLTVSKLNEYQYLNVEEYERYQEGLGKITGRTAKKAFQEITNFFEKTSTINLELENHYLSFSEEAKNLVLVNLSGSDYLQALMTKVDGKHVFTSVLNLEKENPAYSQLKEIYDELVLFEGYLLVLEEYQLINKNMEELNALLQTHYYDISSAFTNSNAQSKFEKNARVLNTLAENYSFYSKFSVEIISNMDTYYDIINSLDNEQFKSFCTDFLADGDTKNYPEIVEVFELYLEKEQVINKFNPYLSLAAKLVLSKDQKNWLVKPLWERQALLKTYIFDALSSERVLGSQLYQEYFLYQYLISDYDGREFDIDYFETLLESLESKVNLGIVDEVVASNLIKQLLYNPQGALINLTLDGKLSPTFFADLEGLEHPYLGELYE
jgi:uncharacterized membrane protein required for colicin V production